MFARDWMDPEEPGKRRDDRGGIFYIAPDRRLMAVAVTPRGTMLEAGRPRALFGPILVVGGRNYAYPPMASGSWPTRPRARVPTCRSRLFKTGSPGKPRCHGCLESTAALINCRRSPTRFCRSATDVSRRDYLMA
jgi:hypothetical protein